MAQTAEIESTSGSKYKIIIDYTAGNGYLTINGIEGNRTDGYGPTEAYNASGFTLYVGSHTKTIKFVSFGNKAYKWWNASGTSAGSSSSIGLGFSAEGSNTYEIKVSGSGNSNIEPLRFNWTVNSGSSVVKPTITDPEVSNIKYNGANASFTISNTGGGTITASGIQFSTSNWGSVSATISGTSGSVNTLSRNTTYYYRAYATNSAGTTYSNVKSFTTLMQAPSVNAPVLSNITSTGAAVTVTVTDDGGGSITSIRTDVSPNSSFSPVTDSVNGATAIVSGLSPGTLYYAQSLVHNSQYSTWSSNSTFSTCPTVTINPSSSSDGTIINLGASTVGTVSQWYYSLYDGDGNVLVQDATPGQTISGYTFGNNQVTGLTPGVKYGVSLRVTNTQGAYHSTTGTNSGIKYVTTEQPTAISFSTNGASFVKRQLYVSVNGTAFKLITKDKLNLL